MRILVVGAGFAGATVARELAEAGMKVTVIDERWHVAGNAFDYPDENGILVHKYGPHLFHTNNDEVFEYLSRFTDWTPYQHKVKALLKDGQYVTLPVNRETSAIVGKENVVDVFIRPYTKKMWGKDIEELDPSILSRVPVRDDDNELYFPNDKHQVMPKKGYTALVGKMLTHENIDVRLNTRFTKEMEKDYGHTFNSMPIDEYYDYMFGELPYRSIKFKTLSVPFPRMLPAAVVNFTHDGPNTRVTEWKNIPGHGENPYATTLTFEEPCDYKENKMQRYYPVKDVDGRNRKVYHMYEHVANEEGKTFIGRCGTYQYLDMWMVVAQSLKTAHEYLRRHE